MPLCKYYALGKRVSPAGRAPLGRPPSCALPCRRPSYSQTQAPSVAIQYSLPLLPSVPVPVPGWLKNTTDA